MILVRESRQWTRALFTKTGLFSSLLDHMHNKWFVLWESVYGLKELNKYNKITIYKEYKVTYKQYNIHRHVHKI